MRGKEKKKKIIRQIFKQIFTKLYIINNKTHHNSTCAIWFSNEDFAVFDRLLI